MFEGERAAHFPVQIAPGIRALCYTGRDDFWQHAAPLLDAIFPAYADLGAYGHAVPAERRAAGARLRRTHAQGHHERFLFQTEAGDFVGFSYGDQRDAQTYFMTSSGILPSQQRRGLYTTFLLALLRYLEAIGYERVLSNHHPNNRAVLIAKLKAGFNVTAVNLDERWGAQVELTYLFHDDRRTGYARAFSLEERPTPVNHR